MSNDAMLFLLVVHIWLLMGGLMALLCFALMCYDDLIIWRDWMNRGATRFVSALLPQLRQKQFNRGNTLVHGSDGCSLCD